MQNGQQIVTHLWPHHAEKLTDHDWAVLTEAAEAGEQLKPSILTPDAQARDGIVATLMIVYWGLRVVQIVVEIAKQVSDLPRDQRKKAILDRVSERLTPETPTVVRKRLEEIVEAAQAP